MMMEEKACFRDNSGNMAVNDGSLTLVILQVHYCPQIDTAHFGYVTLTCIETALWLKMAKHSSCTDSELLTDV